MQVCEVQCTLSDQKEKLFCMARIFLKRIVQLGTFFENMWNRLLEHLIWSQDELPPSNRSFGLSDLIKETQIVFFSMIFCFLYIVDLGNIKEDIS